MSKTNDKLIILAAVSELERLSLSIDTELEVIANFTIAEVEDNLREIGLDSNERLPKQITQLLFEKTQDQQNSNISADPHELTSKELSKADNVRVLFLQGLHKSFRDWVGETAPRAICKPTLITPEHVSDRAFFRAAFSLGDLNLAENIAVKVADSYALLSERVGRKTRYRFRKIWSRPNQPFILDQLIFKHMVPHKRKYVSDYAAGLRQLDKETLTLWFLEDLIDCVLDYGFSYAVAAVCRILYNYDYDEVSKIYSALAPDSFQDPAIIRRLRFRVLDTLRKRYASFLELELTNKHELYFRKREDLNQAFSSVEYYLNQLIPPAPMCVNPLEENEGNLGERLLHAADFFDRSDAELLENYRIHTLLHPDCFLRLTEQLKIPAPESRLRLPMFYVHSGSDNPVTEKLDFQSSRLLDNERRKRIATELHQLSQRRKEVSLDKITVAVDGTDCGTLKIGDNTNLRLELKEGACFVEFKTHDKHGEIPLGTHIFHWNKNLLKESSGTYRINVNESQVLRFTTKYTKDANGEMTGVIIEDALIDTAAY